MRTIGQGGMGMVYLARDIVLQRTVALKFIRTHFIGSDGLARFFQEAQAVARLAHPNIVTLFGIHPGDHDGDAPFIEMEYIDGTNLDALVRERGPLDVWQAREYVRMAALGLQHAYEKGLVHRDIKPSNLMLTATGSVVKVLDFGLARLLRRPGDVRGPAPQTPASADPRDLPGQEPGMREQPRKAVGTNPFVLPGQAHDPEGGLMGTLAFISPEQCLTPNVDIRADIYSLGCTFYYLLTGATPFPASGNYVALIQAHQSQEPVPIETRRPEIPRGLAAIIKRMMAKKPEDRYQNPAELILALDRLLQPAAPPPPGKLRTADELVAVLRRHLLLDDRQLDDIELGLAPRFSDVNALLGERACRAGWTDYQCGELLGGQRQVARPWAGATSSSSRWGRGPSAGSTSPARGFRAGWSPSR